MSAASPRPRLATSGRDRLATEPPSGTREPGLAGDRLSGADEWVCGDRVSDDAAGAEFDDSGFDVRAEEGDEGSRPDDGDAGDGSGAEEFAGRA
jgi:hypothetical protein